MKTMTFSDYIDHVKDSKYKYRILRRQKAWGSSLMDVKVCHTREALVKQVNDQLANDPTHWRNWFPAVNLTEDELAKK